MPIKQSFKTIKFFSLWILTYYKSGSIKAYFKKGICLDPGWRTSLKNSVLKLRSGINGNMSNINLHRRLLEKLTPFEFESREAF